MALSVLDQSPVPHGSTAATALADTIGLAQEAERLGYRRYWLAEHHNTASLAGSAPEVLAACVATRTTSIRVGAGGVLLSHYSPLKVAECFRLLEELFPGRIDLGLGRAAGADDLATAALEQGPGALPDEEYPRQVADLVGFLHGTLAAGHRFTGVEAMPTGPGVPQVWVLGSSSYGAGLAARLGLPFCFAHFVSPRNGPQVLDSYRRLFRPSPGAGVPQASVAVTVICAATDAEGERLATSHDVWSLRPEGAGRGPLLAVEEAEDHPVSELERALIAQHRQRRLAGGPDRVRAGLEGLASAYGVDELVVRTICHDPEDRLRSYQLLAEAFDLNRS